MSTLHDFLNHPIETLERALHIRKQITQLQKELSALFGAHPPAIAGLQLISSSQKGKRKMSAAARERIAAAQRARWAKSKGKPAVAPKTVVKAATPRRQGLTPEGRAKLAAAMKARWAARKKGAPALNAPAKSAAVAKPAKKKSKLSPEGRARIVAALKARWAAKKTGSTAKNAQVRKKIATAGQPKFRIL